jgi:hypothetical protein
MMPRGESWRGAVAYTLTSEKPVNSFQLTTFWILGIAAIVAGVWVCAWLVAWTLNCRRQVSSKHSGTPSYRIDAPFVEICVSDGYSLSDLRAFFESIRDDPGLPCPALLLFDGSARTERLTDADVRARFAVFVDTLRPRIAPAYAVVVSAAIVSAAETAQREAAAVGLRVGLFLDFERARGWLSTYVPASRAS